MSAQRAAGPRVDLIRGPVLGSMLRFSVPILVAGIFLEMYSTVDAMMVSHMLGASALAAVGACGAISELLIGFTVGVGSGFGVVAARFFGMGDMGAVRRAAAASLLIGSAISLALGLVSGPAMPWLLGALRTPPESMEGASAYITVIVRWAAAAFLFNLCTAFLQAVGDSVMPLVFLAASACLNIALDYLFLGPLGMGVRGAAVATVIAQAFSAALCALYILLRRRALAPDRVSFRPDRALYAELIAQGLSMGFMGSIISVGSVLIQPAINSLGYLILAGYTAARRLFMLFLLPISAVTRALSTFVSQNVGANSPSRVRAALRQTNLFYFAVTLVIAAAVHPLAPKMIALVSGSADPAVLDSGARYLRFVTLFFWALGLVDGLRYALEGLGQKVRPLVASGIELMGKVLFATALIPAFGFPAVIACESSLWCCMSAYLLWAVYRDPFLKKDHARK